MDRSLIVNDKSVCIKVNTYSTISCDISVHHLLDYCCPTSQGHFTVFFFKKLRPLLHSKTILFNPTEAVH